MARSTRAKETTLVAKRRGKQARLLYNATRRLFWRMTNFQQKRTYIAYMNDKWKEEEEEAGEDKVLQRCILIEAWKVYMWQGILCPI
ncbi:hypothetical protein HPP92_014646 [Vanilla planifolia]|uniref:Uncharacterized protein n=1 Tax=Vanilla planifolia TaxID=51239 RepID=A0A835QHR1_VANPL|nr:hypothetical protein HPP92_014646 [Vanilla planifolia]